MNNNVDKEYRLLASAVMMQAIKDILNKSERDKSLRFLTSKSELDFWCQVAGLDANIIRRLFKRGVTKAQVKRMIKVVEEEVQPC